MMQTKIKWLFFFNDLFSTTGCVMRAPARTRFWLVRTLTPLRPRTASSSRAEGTNMETAGKVSTFPQKKSARNTLNAFSPFCVCREGAFNLTCGMKKQKRGPLDWRAFTGVEWTSIKNNCSITWQGLLLGQSLQCVSRDICLTLMS